MFLKFSLSNFLKMRIIICKYSKMVPATLCQGICVICYFLHTWYVWNLLNKYRLNALFYAGQLCKWKTKYKAWMERKKRMIHGCIPRNISLEVGLCCLGSAGQSGRVWTGFLSRFCWQRSKSEPNAYIWREGERM